MNSRILDLKNEITLLYEDTRELEASLDSRFSERQLLLNRLKKKLLVLEKMESL